MNWVLVFLFFCFSALSLFLFFFSLFSFVCVFVGDVKLASFLVSW